MMRMRNQPLEGEASGEWEIDASRTPIAPGGRS